jgi:hypothetical protein
MNVVVVVVPVPVVVVVVELVVPEQSGWTVGVPSVQLVNVSSLGSPQTPQHRVGWLQRHSWSGPPVPVPTAVPTPV